MIEVKRVEIRDRATLVPAIALRVKGNDSLMTRGGFYGESSPILLIHLLRPEVQHDPFAWIGRTIHEAHKWLEANWDKFKDGDVLDVEFILGETKKPKESDL